MRISYKRYKVSGFATFLSAIGAIAIYMGIIVLVMMFIYSVQGVKDEDSIIFIPICIGMIIVGALSKYKLADYVAARALKNLAYDTPSKRAQENRIQHKYYRFNNGDGGLRKTGLKVEYLDMNGDWIENPDLIKKFVNKDTDIHEITEEEAVELVRSRKGY